jgi:hypothetical protein
MRDTIDMAREAGLLTWLKPPEDVIERFKAFEALVRADERALAAPVQELSFTLKENAIGCGLKDPITAAEHYSKHIEVQNLYEPAQPAQRKPLTDEQMDRCIEAADTNWASAYVPVAWARHFAKAIEAAHGITEKGQL